MQRERAVERVETVVIGGGQAGLAVGYHLLRRGRPFLILDAEERVGDAWRARWDSLLLFTPARFSSLPGRRHLLSGGSFLTKDQMADYLEDYARHFKLPVRSGVRVDGLSRQGERFLVTAGERRYEAEHVVVAMAGYQSPKVPAFAAELDRGIVQIHSAEYRNPSQLQPGGVLVVGLGNSGADIGMEVVKTHPTFVAGKESGAVPFRIETFISRNVLIRLVRFIGHRVLTVATPIGRKMRMKMLHKGSPLVRVKPWDLEPAGIERVGRVAGVRGGKPVLDDGRVLDVSNVVWCTGYHPGFSWIRVAGALEPDGYPVHEGGVSPVAGLYFVGLHFLYAATSATITGVGRDAERVVGAIVKRARVGRAA